MEVVGVEVGTVEVAGGGAAAAAAAVPAAPAAPRAVWEW